MNKIYDPIDDKWFEFPESKEQIQMVEGYFDLSNEEYMKLNKCLRCRGYGNIGIKIICPDCNGKGIRQ